MLQIKWTKWKIALVCVVGIFGTWAILANFNFITDALGTIWIIATVIYGLLAVLYIMSNDGWSKGKNI